MRSSPSERKVQAAYITPIERTTGPPRAPIAAPIGVRSSRTGARRWRRAVPRTSLRLSEARDAQARDDGRAFDLSADRERGVDRRVPVFFFNDTATTENRRRWTDD